MRLEHIPLIIGAIVALIGLGFIADALMADSAPATERRRRIRAERSRAGETVVGVGVLCMAAALLGRDTWRYGTLAVMVGAALVLIGIVLNRTFLKEALFFRGPARRADPSDAPRSKPAARPARPASTAPASPPPVMGRKKPMDAARPPVSPPPQAPVAPAARSPMPAAAMPATPPAAPTATPLRPVDPPTPNPSSPPPTGTVDRRKAPRGKK